MTEMIFYGKIVSVDHKIHQNVKIKPVSDYLFAARTNSVPLATVEFFEAAKEYPIVFVKGQDNNFSAVALLGLRDNENLFVSPEGRWEARYIPAYVRRYPFISATTEAADRLLICIDEEYAGFNAEDGQPLFIKDGQPAPILTQATELISDFHAQFERSRQFTARLNELGLIQPLKLEIKQHDGRKAQFKGLFAVNEEALLKLSDQDIPALFRDGSLGLIYAHLTSIGNLRHLPSRMTANK